MSLLALLQLASPALPVGAYSYSEGIEWLVERGVLRSSADLERWLRQELQYGAVQVEGQVLRVLYGAIAQADNAQLDYWNRWLSAQRETEELRHQSWQMGQALLRLLQDMGLFPDWVTVALTPCNYGVAFALTAYQWGLTLPEALVAYLFSWAANLVSAGVRAIPIGPTEGQKLLFGLHGLIHQQTQALLAETTLPFYSCSVGLGLASMYHETQYSRLFRS
ncbi:MAG: urease accessory protein UreF [Gloeomargarita sp. HHBFW_bins_205]